MSHYLLVAAVAKVPTLDGHFTCQRCHTFIEEKEGSDPPMTRLIVIREDDPERRAVQLSLCQNCGEPFQGLAAIRLASDQLSAKGGVTRAAEYFFEATRWARVIELLQEEAREIETRTLEALRLSLPEYFPALDSVAEETRLAWERTRKPGWERKKP